jgi:predicted RNA-binding Zn-ribbon protein involved in translation (DUF1610 family)
MGKFKVEGDRGAVERLWRALHFYQDGDRKANPLGEPIVSASWPIDPKLPHGPYGVSTNHPHLLHTMARAAGVTVEPLDERAEPHINEASLFDELKSIAKAICDFAYENKTAQAVVFDVVAKDGGLFRVSVNLLRHDVYPHKPIVVLEPKPKDHHLDSCHNCDINAKPEPKLGSYPCPECGYINNRPGTCSNAGEHRKKETIVYGTRPDGSYRSPENWTVTYEAEYQAFVALMQQRNPALAKQPDWVSMAFYADPEQGRENYMSRRDLLIEDGWVKVK